MIVPNPITELVRNGTVVRFYLIRYVIRNFGTKHSRFVFGLFVRTKYELTVIYDLYLLFTSIHQKFSVLP